MKRVEPADYVKIDGINWSTLKHMAKSPLHFDYARKNPSKDTTGRLKGRATHTATLEPDRLLIDYALFKGKVRRGKEWDAFKEMHDEESIIKRDEYEHCLAVSKAVRRNEEARRLLDGAEVEKTITWTDKETGLKCKSRVDILNGPILADLKGVRSVEGRALSNEVAKMFYHAQMAMYLDGVKQALGIECHGVFICVEHAAPFDVAVIELDDGSWERGYNIYRELLNRVAECTVTGRWPGRYETRQLIALPAWAFDESDDDDEFSFEVSEAV